MVEVGVDQPLPVPPIQLGHFDSVGARVGPVNVPVNGDESALTLDDVRTMKRRSR